MKQVSGFLFFCLIVLLTASFREDKNASAAADPAFIHRTMKEVTDVIVHDIYSPPVASRIYAYVSVAGYEAAITGDAHYYSLAGQVHGLQPVPGPGSGTIAPELAAIHAMLLVAKALVISEERIENFHTALLEEYKKNGLNDEVYEQSLTYGKSVADHILAWAGKDNYKETRALSKYAVKEDSATWKPTPPAYIKAIEPHWGKMRTFILDSVSKFRPVPALPFSTDTVSNFYKEAKAVYNTGQQLSAEQKNIAAFWDCNPYKMNINGHVMYATKKISPGGHWINITALACKQAHAGFTAAAEAYACVSLAVADAFISCWDEKYRSIVIRPESYINQYIDAAWMPFLQTPPFPEYTSGHSVISATSATVLTKLFGEHFVYADSTEMEFEIPPRSFTSFKQAAEEAAISRFYGGIHYMSAIKNGIDGGYKIGDYVTAHIRTKK